MTVERPTRTVRVLVIDDVVPDPLRLDGGRHEPRSGPPRCRGAEDVERYVAALARPGAVAAGINYYRAMFRRSPGRARDGLRPIAAPVLVV